MDEVSEIVVSHVAEVAGQVEQFSADVQGG
jgi:hypothetical protein